MDEHRRYDVGIVDLFAADGDRSQESAREAVRLPERHLRQ